MLMMSSCSLHTHRPQPESHQHANGIGCPALPDTEWRKFGLQIDVARSKLDGIESQFSTDGERNAEVFNVYLTEHPQPTWDHVSDMLYQFSNGQYHSVLDSLQSMFPTGECAEHVHVFK